MTGFSGEITKKWVPKKGGVPIWGMLSQNWWASEFHQPFIDCILMYFK